MPDPTVTQNGTVINPYANAGIAGPAQAPQGKGIIGQVMTPFGLTSRGGLFGAPYQVDNDPQPIAPDFKGIVGPDGQLLPQYQIHGQAGPGAVSALSGAGMTNPDGTPSTGLQGQLSGINLNTDVLSKLNGIAGSYGNGELSPWGKAMQAQNTLQTGQATDAATALAGSNAAGARSNMAAHGGLSSGAMENIERNGANAGMAGRQGAQMAGAQNALGITAQDNQQQLGLMEQIPGMQAAALQPALQKAGLWGEVANSDAARNQALGLAQQQYGTDIQKTNVGNTLSNTGAYNAFNQANYSNAMSGWSAGKTATAQANSAKK